MLSLHVFGQKEIEIKGLVLSKNGTPLPGTNISLNKNRLIGTVTNACGEFKLKIPEDRNDYLMFSMISEPFYFDLRQITDKDLNKTLVFRIILFRENRKSQNIGNWKEEITIDCEEFNDKKTFRLTKKNRKWPTANKS